MIVPLLTSTLLGDVLCIARLREVGTLSTEAPYSRLDIVLVGREVNEVVGIISIGLVSEQRSVPVADLTAIDQSRAMMKF